MNLLPLCLHVHMDAMVLKRRPSLVLRSMCCPCTHSLQC